MGSTVSTPAVKSLETKQELEKKLLGQVLSVIGKFRVATHQNGKSEDKGKRKISKDCFGRAEEIENITKMEKAPDQQDFEVMEIDPSKYEYPFENLVFEGGGCKGLAFAGVLQVLEDMGIKKNIKRIAGASAGAMTATMAAVGCNAAEIEKFSSQNLKDLMLDARFGVFSLLPNMISNYGWNPGNRIYDFFGDIIEEKMGNRDLTFLQLYKRTGIELCIIITNLNHMSPEYCHAKTTPDMAIRFAVRISLSIPGLFEAATYTRNGEDNTYVDGGILCNYPIHCYDGWWLSMKKGDRFLTRLHNLSDLQKRLDKSERFGEYNDKTLGFQVYADSEPDLYRFELENRVGAYMAELPDTLLAKKKEKEDAIRKHVHQEHGRITNAVNNFFELLTKHDADKGGSISRKELENAMKDESFSDEEKELLFGDDYTTQSIFDYLDEDKDGKIRYNEMIHFVERKGIFLQQRYLGYRRKEISGLVSFLDTLSEAVLSNVKKIYFDARDVDRTVGINTGHINTTDFDMEEADKEYIIEQGKRTTLGFLKYYAFKHNLSPKGEAAESGREYKETADTETAPAEPTPEEQTPCEAAAPEDAS